MTQDFHAEQMLEAFLMGHLSEQRRVEMEHALAQDASLAKALSDKKELLGLSCAMLSVKHRDTETKELDPLLLAQYLDGSLNASEKQQLEQDLAASLSLQQQLITLYRETRAATEAECKIEMVEQRPAGGQAEFSPVNEETIVERPVSDVETNEKPSEAAG